MEEERLYQIILEYVIKFKKSEYEFGQSMTDRGIITYSSREQDMIEHWDVQVNDIKYDVKSIKKINRNDEVVNENIHWIELKNVNGKLGWLYVGLSTHIVFELEDYWVIVLKTKLQEFIAEKCKDKIKCDKPSLYKLYTRKDRKDMITLVKTIDLIYISEEFIKK